MHKSLSLILMVVLIPSIAQAQVTGAFDMGVLGMNGAIDHVTKSEQARSGGSSVPPVSQSISRSLTSQAKGPSATQAQSISGTYRPSDTVRKRIAGILADASEQRSPGTGQEMHELVLSGKTVREYQRVAPSIGLRSNDAIDALAFYLLAQWGVANDYRADITPTQAAGVRQQAASTFADIAEQLRSSALRQEFAEVLIVQGVIMAGAHEAAVRGNDQSALAQYVSMARRGGRALFTMDPTRIVLTDQGFRAK